MVDVTTAFKNECEANVGTYKFGKVKVNLIDNNPASWEIGEYSSSNGTKIDTANMTRLSSLSKCEPNKQYTVSLNNSNFRLRLAYFNASQTYISSSATLTGGTITTPANTKYIGATLWNNANTYTGTNINLQNSTNDKLVSYNLEGQTTQSGTPTPTSPVNVDVVKGKNIFDIGQITDYVSSAGLQQTLVQGTTNNILSIKIAGQGGTYCYNSKNNYIGGKNYVITGVSSKTYSRLFIRLRKVDGSGWMTNSDTTITGMTYNSYYGGWYANISTTAINKTINVPVCAYFQIGFGFANISVTIGDIETITNIQLEQGSTATPYLPYNTIQAKVLGKNLLDSSILELFSSNKYVKTPDYNTKGTIMVRPNTTYTLSSQNVYFTDINVYEFDENNNKTTLVKHTIVLRHSFWFTTSATAKTISFYSNNNGLEMPSDLDFQIELRKSSNNI